MPDLKIRQLKSESNAWKRSLGFMSEENILMKNRLSEILKDDFDINLLPKVEYFHKQMLNEEEFIHLLRHNVSELDKYLSRENLSQNLIPDVNLLRSRLQYQITVAETRFNKLKTEFYVYLSENL